MDVEKRIKYEVSNGFKLTGFTLRRDAVAYVAEQISTYSSEERLRIIDKLASHMLHLCPTQPVIEKDQIESAYKEISTEGLEEGETVFSVIDAFKIPKLIYNFERKMFTVRKPLEVNLFPEPTSKSTFLIDRYNIIWQRTARNKLFASELLPGSQKESNFKLRKIEVLLSTSSKINNVVILGLLTQLTEGKYYLEDPTGSVMLDLSEARYHSGLFTEYSYVLAEGYYEDKVFYVMGLVLPPSEDRNTSMPYFGNINTFGGTSKSLLKHSVNLQKLESLNADGMFIFLSDVWFDDIKVMEKLKILMSGYNEFPPIAIIFMGEFLSCPYGAEHSTQLKAALNNLADVILLFPKLREVCKFIFVPGRGDPNAANILPRTAIPDSITIDIRNKLGTCVIFTSNPVRVQYCTQEFVLIRQDLVTKMCRNSIQFPEKGDIPDHLTKTILSQCTLSPLSLGIQPLFWNHADALSLYPVPDLIVVADSFQPYTRSYQGCQVVNPGSFPKTEFSFKVYVPSTRTVEDSQIPKDSVFE